MHIYTCKHSHTRAHTSYHSTEWPTSPEDWKNLFQQYWEQQEEDKEQIKNILHGVIDALQQVHNTLYHMVTYTMWQNNSTIVLKNCTDIGIV